MKKKIFFLEKSIEFNSYDINSNSLGGAEKILINIANELAKNKNLSIKVFNESKNKSIINNVIWDNLNKIDISDEPDFLIAMSDANLLSIVNCKKKYLWSHSVQNFEKFVRKNQLLPFIINKPSLILEGDYHYNTRSFLTSFFGKNILKVAADNDFINKMIIPNSIPPKNVIFNTRSDRNLNIVIETWKLIKKQVLDAKLYINPPYELKNDETNLDIFIRKKVDKSKLIEDLSYMKLMINPGHKGEVFCLVAEEAQQLCIPIVTLGYGSLYERIIDKKTGFLCKSIDELAEKAIQILNDDSLYLSLKSNLYSLRGNRTYKQVADDLIKILSI